jgi:hypothetical protein
MTGTFRDCATQALADPTAVVFRLYIPGNTVVVYTYGVNAQLVRDSTGVYHVDYTTSHYPGDWVVRWEGTGACEAATEKAFRVWDSRVI